MGKIPLAAQLLSTGKPKELNQLLVAAILHSEEDMLVVTESELHAAENYTLVVTIIPEEDTVVLTARAR